MVHENFPPTAGDIWTFNNGGNVSSNFRCSLHPRYQGIFPPPKDREGHVCEMCDWVWHGSDHYKTPSKTPWKHAESLFNLAKGGDRFGELLKQQAFKYVRVVTDDAEIALGLLIRDDEDGQIRVGHRVSVPNFHQHDDVESYVNLKRRPEWRLDAISRDRIKELRVLS